MPTELQGLTVTKVALCGRGMNPEAEVMLFKSAIAKTTTSELSEDLEEAVEELLGLEDVWIRDISIDEGWFVYSTMDNDSYQMDYTLAADGAVSLTGQPVEVECVSSYEPIEKAGAPRLKKEAPVADDITKADHDAVIAERDALRTELDALKAVEPTEDDVLKSLPDAVRARIEKAEAEAKSQAERIEKMEQAARTTEFIAKAAEFEHVAGAGELGPVLEQIDRLAPEAGQKITQYLKAAEARITESGLFKTFGSDGENDSTDDPATAAINKAVADGTPRHEAVIKVFAEHPEWYAPAKTV